MLSKSDLKILQELFDTQEQKLDVKFSGLRRELKNDIIEFKDKILGEIVKLREEVSVTSSYRDMIEDHDTRITKLEEKLPSAS